VLRYHRVVRIDVPNVDRSITQRKSVTRSTAPPASFLSLTGKNQRFSSARLSLIENKIRFLARRVDIGIPVPTLNNKPIIFLPRSLYPQPRRDPPLHHAKQRWRFWAAIADRTSISNSWTRKDKAGSTARPVTGSTYSTMMPSRESPSKSRKPLTYAKRISVRRRRWHTDIMNNPSETIRANCPFLE